MKPLDGLRLLPLELDPPRGLRERTRQRLLTSISGSLAPPLASDVVPRPIPTAALGQTTGVKLALVALGSVLVGATLAVSVPILSDRLRDARKQQASAHEPLSSMSAPSVPSAAFAAPSTAFAMPMPAMVGSSTSPSEATALSRRHGPSSVGVGSQSSRPSQPKTTNRSNTAATSLAAERQLLDAAREQLSSGHSRHAFELTELHLKRFATGKLAEEREALAIVALARAGERARSSQRAERFKQFYPNSFLGKVVESSLGESQ